MSLTYIERNVKRVIRHRLFIVFAKVQLFPKANFKQVVSTPIFLNNSLFIINIAFYIPILFFIIII